MRQHVWLFMLLTSSATAVGLKATFKELSTEDYNQRLLKVYQFPEHLALTLAENLSVYRDNPEAWVEGADYSLRDVCLRAIPLQCPIHAPGSIILTNTRPACPN